MKKIFFVLALLPCLISCADMRANSAEKHFNLAQDYYHAQNYGDAFDEMTTAAEKGNVNAQYALGYMYMNGIGTGVNRKQGLYWIKQAASQGQAQAITALNVLNKNPNY